MANLSTQHVDLDGLDPTYTAAAAGGDRFAPHERTVLHVKNGSAASINVTVTTPAKRGGLNIADQTVAVPAGGERFIRPAAPEYIRASDGMADLTYSDVTSLTVAVLRA